MKYTLTLRNFCALCGFALVSPLWAQQFPIVKVDSAPLPTALQVSVRIYCESGETITFTKNGATPSISDASLASGDVISFGRFEILKVRTWLNGVGSFTRTVQFHHVTGSIAAGDIHSLAFKSNFRGWAWGQQLNGRLGNGATASLAFSTPVMTTENSTRFAGGLAHSLSIVPFHSGMSDAVFAFGSNSAGQLGQNETTTLSQSANPLQVRVQWTNETPSFLSDCRDVSAASNYSAALTHGGEIFTWGNQTDGRLGSGRAAGSYKFGTRVIRALPVTPVTPLSQIVRFSAGDKHSLAVDSTGLLWGWGDAGFGQLGQSNTTDQVRAINLNAWNDVADVACGDKHSLVLRRGPSSDGIVFAAGLRDSGRLGYVNSSTTGNQTTFVQVLKITGSTTSPLNKIVQLSAGPGHSLALDEFGNVWSWGNNIRGQLGLGNTTNRFVAHQIPTLSNITQIRAGGGIADGFSFAIAADGTVYAWGANANGQLGLSNTVQQNSPVAISQLKLTNQGAPTISLFHVIFSDIDPGTGALIPTVSDPDGSIDIKSVESYFNYNLHGTATASPWSFSLQSLSSGNYNVLTRAIDSYGDYADSNTVQFTIRPKIQVSLLKSAIPEGQTASVFRISRSSVGNSALSVAIQISGSAQSGVDYAALSSNYTIPAGSLHVDIPLEVFSDAVVEAPESVVVELLSHASYALTTGKTSAELSVYDESFFLGDFDGDGLTGEQELLLGADPTKIDSDGDGLADGVDAEPLVVQTAVFIATKLMVTTPLK